MIFLIEYLMTNSIGNLPSNVLIS